jgi:hypothetical protein
VVAVVLGLAGPAAYAIDTVSSTKAGSIPIAGPASQGGFGPGGGMRIGRGMAGGGIPPGMTNRQGTPPTAVGRGGATTPGQMGARVPQNGATETFGGVGGMGGTGGGLLQGSRPSDELVALLNTSADDFTWVAAAIGSNSASGYQLATEHPVMPIGGFNGSDPSPTLAEFQKYVEDGEIHYFIASGGDMMGGGMMGGDMTRGGGSGTGSEITAWVKANFTSTTVDGVTLYDLTAAS